MQQKAHPLQQRAEDALEVVKRHRAHFDKPSVNIPQGLRDDGTGRTVEWGTTDDTPHWTSDWGFSVDAPLLGNGDLLAALAGDAQWPQFWVTTNDFWDMKSDGWLLSDHSYGGVGPRPLGRLVFEMPALAGATIVTEQDFATATTITRITSAEGNVVCLRSWVAAGENLFVVEFETESHPVDLQFLFKFPTELGSGVDVSASPSVTKVAYEQGAIDELGIYESPARLPMHTFPSHESGWADGAFWATRTYDEDVDQSAMLAIAGRILEQGGAQVTIKPGEPLTFVAAVRSWHKTIQPLQMAKSRAIWITSDEVNLARDLHEAWWKRYWNTSYIEIDDALLEQRYYLSHYVMGSLSRDPEFPPTIFGVQVWDDPGWCGDYKINYNHQSPFLGLYASGHFEQADPHDAPYLATLDRAREMARRVLGHGGAHFPLGLGPKGLVCENGTWGMKSHNVQGLLNVAMRWYLTYDEDYALKVYPLIRAGADFWEGDLHFEDGRYAILNDTAHETHGEQKTKNPISSLGFVRATLRLAISISAALGIDAQKRVQWQQILDNVSDFPIKAATEVSHIFGVDPDVRLIDIYPAGTLKGKDLFMLEEEGSQWSLFGAAVLEHVYPGGEVGLDSPPELLKAARDTIEIRLLWHYGAKEWSKKGKGAFVPSFMVGRGAWTDFHTSSLFFPAAVRIGFDPETIWQELHNLVDVHGRANGFLKNNPHGIENCSTVPNTLQEMMLLSHEGILRFFKVWPRTSQPNARFVNLRACGAFVVSADLVEGEVAKLHIVSLKGRDCTFENPWPEQNVVVCTESRENEVVSTMSGERCNFRTRIGERYQLRPDGA